MASKPVEHRAGRFLGHLLLDPVAAIEAEHIHIRHQICKGLGWWNRILRPVNHEGGLSDDRVRIRQNVPVAIQVSIPVDARREPGGREGCDEDGKVVFAHHGIARGRIGRGKVYHHHARFGWRGGYILAKQISQKTTGVRIKHRVRDPRSPVEVHEIVVGSEQAFHERDPGNLAYGPDRAKQG